MGEVFHAPCTRSPARLRHDLGMPRGLRILSVALIAAGAVVLADVGVTVAWEEPVSSIYGAIQQGRAEGELDDLERSFLAGRSLPDVEGLTDVKAARRLAGAFEAELETGSGMGRIEIPGIGLDAVIVQGTDTATLQKGPGHYPQTGLPGQGTTIGIAGHRTTYLAPFRDIDDIDQTDELVVEVPYGSFTYTVEKTRIVDPSAVRIVRDVEYERLVLTACHPLYSAAERYAVFGRLTEIEIAGAED
ncbi:MAG TPA: class E sortase [Solirubrobacterales bacterium]|jgi:sortase A|nr:class E sortase [Solirubrobacterales bacterium]